MDPSPTQRDLLPVNRSIVRVSFQVKEKTHMKRKRFTEEQIIGVFQTPC